MRYEKVVVTGGSGLLGRFVVGELIDRCAVTVLDIAGQGPATETRAAIRPYSMAVAPDSFFEKSQSFANMPSLLVISGEL